MIKFFKFKWGLWVVKLGKLLVGYYFQDIIFFPFFTLCVSVVTFSKRNWIVNLKIMIFRVTILGMVIYMTYPNTVWLRRTERALLILWFWFSIHFHREECSYLSLSSKLKYFLLSRVIYNHAEFIELKFNERVIFLILKILNILYGLYNFMYCLTTIIWFFINGTLRYLFLSRWIWNTIRLTLSYV